MISAFGMEATAQANKSTNKSSSPTYVLADFRGIKWGAHVDSIKVDGKKLTFTKSADITDKNAYTLANDDMTIGTVNVDKIYYIFNANGRFNGVMVIGKKELGTKKQFGEMKYILKYKFGEPELKEITGGVQYYWMVDDVRITLDDQDAQGTFTLEFYSDFERSESKRINTNVDDF